MKSRFHSKAFKTFICFSIKQKKFEFLAKSDKKSFLNQLWTFSTKPYKMKKSNFFTTFNGRVTGINLSFKSLFKPGMLATQATVLGVLNCLLKFYGLQ